ncbi:hypothetical protein PCAR4_10128 [Paraburkholderia caribensis]|nr:hypothetical protein PCAR4_10128 [Paraburkholderia caribensis]
MFKVRVPMLHAYPPGIHVDVTHEVQSLCRLSLFAFAPVEWSIVRSWT